MHSYPYAQAKSNCVSGTKQVADALHSHPMTMAKVIPSRGSIEMNPGKISSEPRH